MQHDLFHVYTVDQHILHGDAQRAPLRHARARPRVPVLLASSIAAVRRALAAATSPRCSTTSPRAAAATTPSSARATRGASAASTASSARGRAS
ncbi:MAG: hypothetical protein MZW92_78215 [Comamonadaceae bacterium]|nr:hypothetical protein [Comamonadaceae bacterium]